MSDYDPAAFDAFEKTGWGAKEAAGYNALAGRVTTPSMRRSRRFSYYISAGQARVGA
jgi:hypothetical protein